MKRFIPTEQETSWVTSREWGNAEVATKTVQNGSTILRANFSGKWREFNYEYYHNRGKVSYAQYIDDSYQKRRECVDYLKSRNVPYLVHFTPLENLPHILSEGICPRTEQKGFGLFTDENRYDRHFDCSSFSITYPNYVMLYKKRGEKFGGNGIAILTIDCEALMSVDADDVAFYPTNAAWGGFDFWDFDRLHGVEALRSMFGERVKDKHGIIRREDQTLSSEYTTIPQAEILIRGVIPSEYIRSIILSDTAETYRVSRLNCGQVRIFADSAMFWPKGIWGNYEQLRRGA